MLERIVNNEDLLAIIIYKDFSCSGAEFLTQDSAPMQVGVMCHPQGHRLPPHIHIPCERRIQDTQEVLFIRKGKVQVDFYDKEETFLESRIAGVGDVIVLISGGHGFTVLEDLEMIEAKTGPYLGEKDKVWFKPDA